MTFKAIDCAQLKERLSEDNLVIADIRDVNSFNEAHIPNSINVWQNPRFHQTNFQIMLFPM